jgi:hypothetical protein
MAGHFWAGSMCLAGGRFPSNAIAISDTIAILEDMGNRIPDKSWMLYLLEVFDRRSSVPVELNMICQFNDRDDFWAIFAGVNRYKFTKVPPVVGHSYLRQIIMRKESKSIEYSVMDRSTGEAENFVFNVEGAFAYLGANHFTGIEWWNKVGGSPFPIRYRAEIADLMYGVPDDNSAITYWPYSALVPNSDKSVARYPVSFESSMVKGGCICYTVGDGMGGAGMRFAAHA